MNRIPFMRYAFLILVFFASVYGSYAQVNVFNGAQWVAALANPAATVINVQADFAIRNSQLTRDGVTINGNNHIISYDVAGAQSNVFTAHLLSVGCDNLVVRDLTFQGKRRDLAYGGGGMIFSPKQADPLIPSNNLTFENVSVIDNEFAGVSCSEFGVVDLGPIVTNLTFTNFDANLNGLSGVQLIRADQVNFNGGLYFQNEQSGIYFEKGVTNAVVNNVDVYQNGLPALTPNTNGNNGAGIRVFDGGVGVEIPSTDITISNSRIYDNNIHGIELPLNSDRINIFLNEIYENGINGNGNQGAGVVFQFGESDDCTVAENNIYDNADAGIYMYKFAANGDHSGNIFYRNTLDNNGGGVVVLSSTNSFIAENSITNTVDTQNGLVGGTNAIYFGDNSSNGVVWNNDISTTATGYGVLISDVGDGGASNPSNDVYILENTISDAVAGGIRVENSNDSRIGNSAGVNTITRNVVGYGNININPTGVLQNEIFGNTVHCIDMFNSVGVQIDGNLLGTQDGLTPSGNSGNGINLESCTNILIGTTQRNVISGSSTGWGIFATLCDNIQIDNNYVGLNQAGTAALPNGLGGIFLGATNNSNIGGNGRNVISGNGGDGVEVSNNATLVVIEDNFVGLNATGTAIIPNVGSGLHMTGANQNSITDNYVSGNGIHGIFIESANSSTNTIRDNNVGILFGGGDGGNTGDGIRLDQCVDNTLESNNIGYNDGDGISLYGIGTNGNDLISNYIGIDNTNTTISNDGNGIYIASVATNNQIGNAGTGNYISGNGENGIMIDGSEGNGIDGNIIGLNTTRTAVIPNGAAFSGIHITGGTATNNIVGNIERNYIAGAHQQQILIDAGANGNEVKNVDLGDAGLGAVAQATGNAILVSGNGTDNNIIGGILGTDENNIYHSNNVAVLIDNQASSNTVKSNIFEGVGATSPISAIQITDGNSNIIGGGDATQGNVIKTTSADAIVVDGNSDGNQIQFNFIGVDENEVSQGPIDGHGILLTGGGVSNTIVNENVIGNISNALNSGVHIDGVAAISTLYGNYIGLNRTDTPIPNQGNGVSVLNSSTAVSVGTIGQNPNIISNNVGHGVELSNSTNTSVLNNHIGTNVAGTGNAGNTLNGIHVGPSNNGVTISENIVRGNTLDNILIDNDVAGNTLISNNRINASTDGHGVNVTAGTNTNLTISGNGIGVELGNATTDGNALNGVMITGFSGTALVENNVIGGNDYGVELDNATGVTLDGNFISMSNNTPSENIANSLDAVYVHSGSNGNSINGNAIGFSPEHAIEIDGVTGTTVSNNIIGLSNDGNNQNVGNALNGVALLNGANGSTLSGNVIGFSGLEGVLVSSSNNNTIDGNFVGTDAGGGFLDFANGSHGISITGTSSVNTISTNRIGHHDGGNTAVNIEGAAAVNNSISENSMFCNEGSNLTTNGTGIAHAAAGNGNYPFDAFDAEAPVLSNNSLSFQNPIAGTSAGDLVEVFGTDDQCTNCQGLTFIGSATMDATGNFDFAIPGGANCATSTYVITITDGTGNTSEFSACSICPPCSDAVVDAGDDAETCFETAFDLSTRGNVTDSTGSEGNGTILWEDFNDANDAPLAGTFSSTSVLNPTYTPPTGFSGDVRLRVIVSPSDAACVADTDTVILNVQPLPVANAGDGGTICEGTSIVITNADTANIATNDFSWAILAGGGTITPATSTTLAPEYNSVASDTSITVVLELTANAIAPCLVDSVDTVRIEVTPNPIAANTVSNAEVCENSSYTVVGGEVTASHYTALSWAVTPAGSGTITSGGTTLTPTYSPSATAGGTTVTLTMTATAVSPCVTSATTNFNVDVTEPPVVDAGSAVDVCVDGTITLGAPNQTTPASESNTASFSWSGGLGSITNGTTLAPTYDPNDSESGNQVMLYLTGVGNLSCNDTTDSVAVTVNALPVPVIAGERQPCASSVEVYSNTATVVGPATYVWSNTVPLSNDNGITTNPTYSITYGSNNINNRTGNVSVTITDGNGCVGSRDTAIAVTISTAPVVTATSTAICGDVVNGPVPVDGSLAGGLDIDDYNFQWYRGDDNTDRSDPISGVLSGSPATNLAVGHNEDIFLSAVLKPGSSCPSTAGYSNPIQTTIDLEPILQAPSLPFPFCVGEHTVTFTDYPSSTPNYSPTYTWRENGQPSSSTGLSNTFTRSTPGVYNYEVTADNGLCSVTRDVDVTVVAPNVQASVSPDVIYEGDDAVVSASNSSNGNPIDVTYTWSWTSTDGTVSNDRSFNVSPIEATTYFVSSSIVGVNNCTDTDEVTLNVVRPPLPDEVFTPGNGDDVNNLWRITDIHLFPDNVVKVYNRWGNVVYEGEGYDYDGTFNDSDTSEENWDGTANGTLVPVATYYYIIELNDADETVLSGSLTIIR